MEANRKHSPNSHFMQKTGTMNIAWFQYTVDAKVLMRKSSWCGQDIKELRGMPVGLLHFVIL
jgi:hypothetical protein